MVWFDNRQKEMLFFNNSDFFFFFAKPLVTKVDMFSTYFEIDFAEFLHNCKQKFFLKIKVLPGVSSAEPENSTHNPVS